MSDTTPSFPDKWNRVQIRRKLRGVDGIRIGPFGSALTLDQMVEEGFKVYGQENVISQDFSVGTRYLNSQKYGELKACSISSGDLLVTMMGTTGRCCVVPDEIAEGIMDSHLIRLRFQDHEVDPSFMALLIDKGHYIKEQISAGSKGTIMSGLNSSIIKDVWVGLPNLSAQRQIAKYVDEQTAKIDRLMEMRRRQLELLKEQRAALIQQAVTRGLNPDVPKRKTDVEWIGDIPAHWKKTKLVRIAPRGRGMFVNGPFGSDLLTSELTDSGVPVVYIRDIKPNLYVRVSEVCVTPEKAALLDVCRVDAGDIVVAKVGSPPGTAAVYPEAEPSGIVTQDVIRIKSDPRIVNAEFIAYWLNSDAGRASIDQISVESTRMRVDLESYKSLRVWLPPLHEQEQIVEHIKVDGNKLNGLVDSYTRQLTLLAEYRAALIHECVTGQREVPEKSTLTPTFSLRAGENCKEGITDAL